MGFPCCGTYIFFKISCQHAQSEFPVAHALQFPYSETAPQTNIDKFLRSLPYDFNLYIILYVAHKFIHRVVFSVLVFISDSFDVAFY